MAVLLMACYTVRWRALSGLNFIDTRDGMIWPNAISTICRLLASAPTFKIIQFWVWHNEFLSVHCMFEDT